MALFEYVRSSYSFLMAQLTSGPHRNINCGTTAAEEYHRQREGLREAGQTTLVTCTVWDDGTQTGVLTHLSLSLSHPLALSIYRLHYLYLILRRVFKQVEVCLHHFPRLQLGENVFSERHKYLLEEILR